MPFDTSKIRQAAKKLSGETSKEMKVIMTDAAKGFLTGKSRNRNPFGIMLFSPPASKGRTGSEAKKAGETAIKNDLAKMFVLVAKNSAAPPSDPISAHRAAQNPRTGRVPRGATKVAITAAALRILQSVLLKRVGWLAAGWLPAAEKLGAKGVPAWIARHTSAPGACVVTVRATGIRLELVNAVSYVGSVADYERRVEKAIEYEAGALERQADFLQKKLLKKAGF